MKKFIFLIFITLFGLYLLGKNVQGSGTYTPSITIDAIEPPKNTKDIIENMSNWFDGSFETISTIPGVKKAWRHKRSSDIILNIVEIEKDKPIGMAGFSAKTYVKALKETRSIIHKLAGIKKWRLTKANVNKRALPKKGILKLQGKYISSRKMKMHFYETQIFNGRKYLQFQISMPEKEKNFFNDKIINAMFKYLERDI